eukprot:XP_001694959.1 dicer-like protein [Chlamydomonas reinhardtii]
MGTALPPLREYQAELLRMARRHASTVIYAETGTGKTRIAVERILEAHGELVAAGRLAAFLAPTVPLVRQQAEVLVAAGLRVVVYTGEDNRDARNRAGWQRLHQEADVLCATPDALNRLIAHAFITIPQLGMIVFDECHHTNANHPYAVLLRVFVRHLTPPDQRPVLLGLTASPHKADELMRLLGAQMVAASNTAQLQTFMAKPRVEVHRQEVEQPATVAPPQRRLASGTFSAAASILPPECAAAVASGDAADMRKAGEALHAGGGSCIAAQPMAALDGAIELVSAAVEYSRCRDQTFRRCCALGEPLPEMRAPRYTSPLLRGMETPQRWWEQDPQCGTKHLEHLRSQLAGVKDALSSMGLWPAVAVAAADLFGPTAAPPQPATLLRLLDSEEGSAWPHLQQRKRLRRGRDNEQRPVPPAAEDVDSSDSDCEDEGDNLPAEHSSSAAGEGEDEGDEADEATLWGYQIGELLEEGGLGDGSEASSIADHRDRAALLVSGLAVMLPPALREALHPLAARDRGDAQPWAELLLRAVPLNKLQQQVLGQDLPSRPAAAATAAVPLAAVVGVPLVTPAVQWVVRSLLALSTQRHPADSGGDGVSVSSGWSAMVFCQRKVACVALHRLLTELPAARGGAIRPAVFMGNTGAGHSASSLAMDGRKQERVRRAFSSGALNVLISTSVGAEGLDFRTCNAVIMVDPPDHVTPFVQCAGRARAPGSCYLLFARDDRQQQAIAKRSREEADMVAKALKLSTAAAREAQQRQQTDPPVNPFFSQDVDVVTEELQQNLFRNLLESYCRTLPGNSGDVLLQPYYSYQEYESPLTRRKAFVATVHMPANSPLGVVEGPMQSNKGDARQHACMATVRRLYELGALDEHLLPRFTRRGRMREAQQQDLRGGGAATAAAATGRTRHRFGVVLHRRLPCDLPPFTAYLPPEDDSEAADGPQGQQPAPVAVRLEYLGPLRLSAAQLAALETAGGVMESLLITRGAQPVATSSSATADKPVAAPGPASAGPVPGSPALAAWSERLGPGLAALRRALAAAGIKTSAAYVHEAVNNVPDRMNSTAGEPATAAQLPASGHWWWLVAPLSEQTQAASSQTAGTEAAAAGAVDWGFLARLAAGPVPLQALCPQLPALRPLAQQPAQGHQQQRQQLLPAAATGADVGSVGLHGHRQAAAPGGQHVELLTAAVREALRGSGGLLITQTGATLHALRGLTAVAEHDEAGTGSRKAAQDAARLVERWGVDPSCLLPDQPQVLVDAGTATRTASNVLLAPPQPEHHPHSHHGAEDGSREAAAVISMLPQALAVAPLSVRCWRALHRTVSLVHRLEGLLVAAEAEEELLRPAGFLRPAATAAASGNPVLAIPVPTTAPSTSTATTAAATPQQAAVLLALTALTARAAADPAFDCERLETLGDAVLKYLATLYVYGTERDVPVSHEGVMSYKRDQLVANEALYGRALEAGLQHHMRALPYDMERVLRGRHWNTGEEAARAQEVRGKRLADCVEALVGCHLAPGVPTAGSSSNSNDAQATSPGSASAPVLVPVSATNPVPGAPCQDGSALAALVAALRQTCAPASGHTGVTDPSSNSGDVHARLDAALRFCCGLGVLPGAAPAVLQRLHAEGQGGAGEGAVQGVPDVGGEAGRAAVGALAAATGYQFHDPALALCALTHVSWPVPPVSSSGKGLDAGAGSGGGSGGHYQLLEFLGDAVVGLLASLWAYSLGGSPRDMSMTREMLVRNDTLAACCLGSRLSTALRVRHRQLQLAIEEYGVALLMSYDTTSGRADAAATGGGGPLIRAEMWKEAMAARDLRVATLLQSAWLEVEGGGTGEGVQAATDAAPGGGLHRGRRAYGLSGGDCDYRCTPMAAPPQLWRHGSIPHHTAQLSHVARHVRPGSCMLAAGGSGHGGNGAAVRGSWLRVRSANVPVARVARVLA